MDVVAYAQTITLSDAVNRRRCRSAAERQDTDAAAASSRCSPHSNRSVPLDKLLWVANFGDVWPTSGGRGSRRMGFGAGRKVKEREREWVRWGKADVGRLVLGVSRRRRRRGRKTFAAGAAVSRAGPRQRVEEYYGRRSSTGRGLVFRPGEEAAAKVRTARVELTEQ